MVWGFAMISVPVKNMQGEVVGTYEFADSELSASINKQLMHDVVVMYESNQRVGTARTKSRGEVRGTTQKMYRQKGTGRARAGSRRSPVRTGGGHTFAKRPKDWSYRMPKKAIRSATRMAILSKFIDGQAIVLDDLSVSTPKTKVVVEMFRALGVDSSCMIAINSADVNVWKSCRNIPATSLSPAASLNAYGVLQRKQFIVTREAMDALRGLDADAN